MSSANQIKIKETSATMWNVEFHALDPNAVDVKWKLFLAYHFNQIFSGEIEFLHIDRQSQS